MILLRGVRTTMMGIGIGLLVALAVSRALASLLFNVSPYDPVAFIVVPVIFVVAAMLASYAPAHRAMSVNPSVALRSE